LGMAASGCVASHGGHYSPFAETRQLT
jgi:hypothetical protein